MLHYQYSNLIRKNHNGPRFAYLSKHIPYMYNVSANHDTKNS